LGPWSQKEKGREESGKKETTTAKTGKRKLLKSQETPSSNGINNQERKNHKKRWVEITDCDTRRKQGRYSIEQGKNMSGSETPTSRIRWVTKTPRSRKAIPQKKTTEKEGWE